MVINHLLNGMILQVGVSPTKTTHASVGASVAVGLASPSFRAPSFTQQKR